MNTPIRFSSFVDALTWATAYNQANANAGLTPVYSAEQMERIKGYMNGTFPYEYDPENPTKNISILRLLRIFPRFINHYSLFK